jgi:multicomponent Na+:H+ antiporter subunit D
LLLPPLITAAAVLAAAIFADSAWSPLSWARLITQREYLNAAP